MSEFIGCTRTNYFHVKDEEAFRKLMSRAVSDTEGIEIWGDRQGRRKSFRLWPLWLYHRFPPGGCQRRR